jgi:hypothetical protein
MTHEQLKANALAIMERFKNASAKPSGWVQYLGEAEIFARAYLAGFWRDDFENCPRDREVLLLWMTGPMVILDWLALHTECEQPRTPDFWAEFTPPTMKEQS